MSNNPTFDFNTAFSRTVGWLTAAELQLIRTKRVAIAGMGGVGGIHLLTHTRLGISNFNIADFDHFDLHNFNRQSGANMESIGEPKTAVMEKMAKQINPELDIRIFEQGLTDENLNDFLDGVDIYVDALDFFALDIRRKVFARCEELGIPAITAAPIGMGAGLLAFLPGKMTFEEYFQLEGKDEQEQLIRFLVGLTPSAIQRKYLIEPSAVNFNQRKASSTPIGCELCAGFAASMSLKLLLNRGRVPAAPHGLHYDAYLNKLKKTWRPFGNRNPLQRAVIVLAKKIIHDEPAVEQPAATQYTRPIDQILDIARWAPSGDNSQVCRFEIINEHQLNLHTQDTRDHCVYDLQGHASQLSTGTMLENIRIAATHFGLATSWSIINSATGQSPSINIQFIADAAITADPLHSHIKTRSVNRKPYSAAPLNTRQKSALSEAIPEGYHLIWIEGGSAKRAITKLLYKNAGLRLKLPEAYATHSQNIEWNAQFSEDKIPDQALGVNPITRKLMQWSLHSFSRVKLLNNYLGGSYAARLEMDIIPSLMSGAHFFIAADQPPQTPQDFINAGIATQRFWLTATQLGLQLQPEMTPLIFSEYINDGVTFSTSKKYIRTAEKLRDQLARLVAPETPQNLVFAGRIGRASIATSRSTRKPLSDLTHHSQ
ncbi:MAG: ThiF family adenylyltransferase [Pseudomonadales bacterium]|nr:ThiF family adenylyltransferase [Pseudomonadales bacterium]